MAETLAIPNWSFYNPALAVEADQVLGNLGCRVHYCQGDPDHRRTVSGFSGSNESVFEGMRRLCNLLLPSIDLTAPSGVHPRSGALDVAPFVRLSPSLNLQEHIDDLGSWLWGEFKVPVRLYEQSAKPGREAKLPVLRGQVGHFKQPFDFGMEANLRWGTTIMGIRDFLLATNIDIANEDVTSVRKVAKEIRLRREERDPIFVGVRALAFPLASRNLTQLSLNLTQPDITSFDDVFSFVAEQLPVQRTELIGVIRRADLPKCTQLTVDPRQVVD